MSDEADVPRVIRQFPAAGTTVPATDLVDLSLSLGPNPTGFDPSQTIISQYANSPTLLQLIASMATYFDPTKNLEAFYNYVWDIDNAVGFGLDIWGRIIGIGRLLQVPATAKSFGFQDGSTTPFDYAPFGQAPFNSEGLTQTYALPDGPYRTLLLVKAFGNICKPTASAINQMLQNLFVGRGRCYVQDYGNMQMGYAFEFPLTAVEYAILTQAGVPPHPAGVQVTINQLDIAAAFGFNGTGLLPFNYGIFYNGA
jgi:hypothetical protein